MEVSQKTKNKITIRPSNSTPGYKAEKNQNNNSKRYMYPMFIAALFTIAKIWKQPKCPLTDEWIKRLWHTYIYKWNTTQP